MSEFIAGHSFFSLIAVCGLVFGGLTALTAAIGFQLERRLGGSRRIFDLPLAEGQLRWEMLSNLRFVAMAAVAFAALLWLVPHADTTMTSFGVTFFVCWFGFEVYFWSLHRLMHTASGMRYHRLHHDSRVTTPLTGYSMSVVESLGWLVGLTGIPLLLGMLMPISIEGFLAYHVLYQISGNVIGHSNVDFFPPAASKRAYSWISHPVVYHSLHHARYNNHYSFGSSFMDRLFGTEWSDWPALHGRVTSGRPLESFGERG